MAAIRPFAALRYNPALVDDLSRVIAPPYDVIDPQEQEQLYAASPHNIVRLTLGKASSGDTPSDNRYTRAQRDFAAWCREGILRPDPATALYLVEHTFDEEDVVRSRLGFLALLDLTGPVERLVYRHEATLAAPNADRTKLLEAVPANLEPIFCVYPDPDGTIQAFLRQLTTDSAPVARATIHGEHVRVWMLTDRTMIEAVARALAPAAVLIADGHHRFEVACAHRARYGALMSYFVSMEEPALRVRPIHRIVQQPAAPEGGSLRSLCVLEPAPDLPFLLEWLHELEAQPGGPQRAESRFGYYDGRGLYRVRISPEPFARWLMAPTVPLALATLDVSVLHGLLLPGLAPPAATGGANGVEVRYTADASEALAAVDRGEGCTAWLLRGIPLDQVYALAAQGLVLPTKSTYFYPKVPSGLTIHPLA